MSSQALRLSACTDLLTEAYCRSISQFRIVNRGDGHPAPEVRLWPAVHTTSGGKETHMHVERIKIVTGSSSAPFKTRSEKDKTPQLDRLKLWGTKPDRRPTAKLGDGACGA